MSHINRGTFDRDEEERRIKDNFPCGSDKEEPLTVEKIFRAALVKYGLNNQGELLVEECAELIVALKHWKRGRTPIRPVVEEMADVSIMLDQLVPELDPELFKKIKAAKISRLAKRLGLVHDEG